RQRGRQQPSALKAVTAGGGRIRPIVEEEAEEELPADLPEDIMQQVPDEILEHQHAFGKTTHLNLEDSAEEEEEDRDRHFGEEQRETAFSRAPLYREPASRFVDDEADDEEETVEIFETTESTRLDAAEEDTVETAREQFAHAATRAVAEEPEDFESEPEIE